MPLSLEVRRSKEVGWRSSLCLLCGGVAGTGWGAKLARLLTQADYGSSPRTHLNSSSLCAFLGHVDMWNGDSLAIGEGAQQMPVHHGLSDSCGLSAGAKAAGHTQRTVTRLPSLASSGLF